MKEILKKVLYTLAVCFWIGGVVAVWYEGEQNISKWLIALGCISYSCGYYTKKLR